MAVMKVRSDPDLLPNWFWWARAGSNQSASECSDLQSIRWNSRVIRHC